MLPARVLPLPNPSRPPSRNPALWHRSRTRSRHASRSEGGRTTHLSTSRPICTRSMAPRSRPAFRHCDCDCGIPLVFSAHTVDCIMACAHALYVHKLQSTERGLRRPSYSAARHPRRSEMARREPRVTERGGRGAPGGVPAPTSWPDRRRPVAVDSARCGAPDRFPTAMRRFSDAQVLTSPNAFIYREVIEEWSRKVADAAERITRSPIVVVVVLALLL